MRYQHRQRLALQEGSMPSLSPAELPAAVALGSAIGTLEMPRLRLSAVIAEGDDEATLAAAIGHLPDTPLPWQDGNSALAAHRDTFFRPLKDVRVGDELRLSTSSAEFRYRVVRTMVVSPQDLWVLDPTERRSLTLITCYPFDYVGPAPQRFIVRAEAETVPLALPAPSSTPYSNFGTTTVASSSNG
jgi:sortase A